MRPFINFSTPLIGREEIAEVVNSLESGWITTGPKVKEFEKKVCAYTGASHATAVSSCTSALFLTLKALGISEGDEVIVPSFTFTSTAQVVIHCGARPVFVDIDPQTLQMDCAQVKTKICGATKAIIPVHYGGNPVEMNKILQMAQKHGLRVVEDAAHAIGAEYKGTKIGALKSDATCFSFYATKNLCTAEGGMVLTEDSGLAAKVRQMTMYGISDSREIWNSRYSKKGHWFYDVEIIGYKANMTDINAAMGLHQLAKLDAFNAKRTEYAAIYNEKLKNTGAKLMMVYSGNKCCWHLMPLILPDDIDRDDLVIKLRERQIGTSVLFRPLHLHSAYRKALGCQEGDFPVSEKIYYHLINLPISPSVSREDIEYAAETTAQLIAK